MKTLLILLLCYFSFFPVYTQAQEKRLALVIGNANYEKGGVLENALNDAELMSNTLKSLGFEVIMESDANLKAMQKAETMFTSLMPEYDVALFYYAGHGIQLDGVNYLLPTDAKLESKLMAKYEAFDVANINRAFMSNEKSVNIMILDACRENPFKQWQRGGERGFKRIEEQPSGTIIAYATSANATADDGDGENGLYTSILVEEMKKPQSVLHVFMNTRRKVKQASEGKQVPEDWNKLENDFFFVKGNSNTSQLTNNTFTNPKVETNVVSNSTLQRGIAQMVKGEHSSAYFNLSDAKDQGNTEAYHYLSQIFYRGVGVEANYDKAKMMAMEGIKAGDKKCYYILAALYEAGLSVEKDLTKSDEYYSKSIESIKKSAIAGNTIDQTNLAYMYSEAKGMSLNNLEAVKWYFKAAEAGYARAQTSLGYMYLKGLGVSTNLQEAAKWYLKGAKQGYARAQSQIGYMYSVGEGVAKDEVEAVRWYAKAAAQDHSIAQYNLAYMYHYGKGVKLDYQEAAKWYRKAADQNYALAKTNLGYMYEKGQGVTQSDKQAFYWYHQAAKDGEKVAQSNLGIMYQYGKGVKKNRAEAKKWYQKSCDNGYTKGCENLRNL